MKSIFERANEQIKTIKEYDQEDEEFRQALSIEKTMEYNIVLGCGGPTDGFKLYANLDENDMPNDFYKGYYYSTEGTNFEETGLSQDEIDLIVDKYSLSVI
jgi:chitinase